VYKKGKRKVVHNPLEEKSRKVKAVLIILKVAIAAKKRRKQRK